MNVFNKIRFIISSSVSRPIRHVINRWHSTQRYKAVHLERILPEHDNDVQLLALHVIPSRFMKSFSSSPLIVWPYIVDQNNEVVDPEIVQRGKIDKSGLKAYRLKFDSLFTKRGGLKLLRRMAESDMDIGQMRQPFDKGLLQSAIENLGCFLQNIEYHEQCLSSLVLENNMFKTSELEVSVLLANHLFSPMVSKDPKDYFVYTISTDSEKKITSCPCDKNCDARVVYGDNSFGSEYLWYGKPDLMLYPTGGGSSAISVKLDMMTLEDDDQDQIVEMTCRDKLRVEDNIKQVAAQAIAFSMCQTKYQKRDPQKERFPVLTSLIPTIVATPTEFDVYFYDSKHDVLLMTTKPIPIFQKTSFGSFIDKFNINSIFQLWMIINHLILQPSLNEVHKSVLEGTCGMQNKIDMLELREKIEESLHMGQPKKALPKEDMIDVEKMKVPISEL